MSDTASERTTDGQLTMSADARSLNGAGTVPSSAWTDSLPVPEQRSGRRLVGKFFKRTFDVFGAAIGLLVLAPYFAYAAVRIKLDSPGPVFFRQPRVGRGGETFNLVKFRTMWEDADARKSEVAALNSRTDGLFKVKDDPRVTKYGRGLRRLALDELPQLVNVLRGDMSLVGPRPLIPVESELVPGPYRARFLVRPGITGPWQAGHADVQFAEMLELDYDYALGWTVSGDIWILVRTVRAVAHRRHAAY